jgi:hypothetical protein
VTRHLSLEWPDPRPFAHRGDEPIRILAVSDQVDPALNDIRSRQSLGPIDVIAGCGDLDCDELAFFGDAFNAPLVYVLGNHDDEKRWQACRQFCPVEIGAGSIHKELGLAFMGLSWPGRRGRLANRTESGAWVQALKLAIRRLGRSSPVIVLSHVPPRDAGDIPTDAYHRGFAGYHWLLEHLGPPLWLHGHTPLAATTEWNISCGRTTLVNVTGAVLIEVWAPGTLRSKIEAPVQSIQDWPAEPIEAPVPAEPRAPAEPAEPVAPTTRAAGD